LERREDAPASGLITMGSRRQPANAGKAVDHSRLPGHLSWSQTKTWLYPQPSPTFQAVKRLKVRRMDVQKLPRLPSRHVRTR